jgi:hypothetical protein
MPVLIINDEQNSEEMLSIGWLLNLEYILLDALLLDALIEGQRKGSAKNYIFCHCTITRI